VAQDADAMERRRMAEEGPGGPDHFVVTAVAAMQAPGFLLHRAEQGMASYGVALRLPFLDRDLLSYLVQLPSRAFRLQGTAKGLLRVGMHPRLPPQILQRRVRTIFDPLFDSQTGVWRDRSIPDWALVRHGVLDAKGLDTLDSLAYGGGVCRNQILRLYAAELFARRCGSVGPSTRS
jgi:asparagine synthetase B (glutamine-hydrolysing)